ncbi:lytic murein transglycosylase B [Kushneria aurantia]|uniref:Lytic murein transglycosylase B n=1 Tax=Kushneria aurantia TaxID=504092 RepID=A0ABV6G2T0_9GAMM|nr:lytic murein transglycosylase B [Kushneria aurantia]
MPSKGYLKGWKCCGAAALLLTTAPALAQQEGERRYSAADNPQVSAVADTLVGAGLNRDEVVSTLGRAHYQQKVIDAITRPAERTLNWGEYRDIFLQPERIEAGAAFIEEHLDAMQRAEQVYGVPREIISAIIGVETFYGRHLGNYRVLDALSTLAFDYPPRSHFFTRELVSFIELTNANSGLDPLQVQGSYAGAIGLPQFIPSSYQAYAVDFNDDGSTDLIHQPVDAIGSVANYFAEHGWRADESIVIEARVVDGDAPEDVDYNQTREPYASVDELERAGLLPSVSMSGDDQVIPLALQDGERMQYLFGLHNFYVITRYNHSHLYAMAVTRLAEAIQAEQGREN